MSVKMLAAIVATVAAVVWPRRAGADIRTGVIGSFMVSAAGTSTDRAQSANEIESPRGRRPGRGQARHACRLPRNTRGRCRVYTLLVVPSAHRLFGRFP